MPTRCTALLPVACMLACYAFPEPERNECGNDIVEAAEDCDDDDPRCSACHLTCTPGLVDQGCPADRICGDDGLCRAPSGEFADTPIRVAREHTRWLEVADLDGDGRGDAIAQLDDAIAAIHLDDEQVEIVTLAQALARPAVGDLDGDRRAELVLAHADARGLSLVRELERDDGGRVSEAATLATLRTTDDEARLLAVAPVRDRVLELVGPEVTRRWSSGAPEALPLDPPLPIDAQRLGTAVAVGELDTGGDRCDGDDMTLDYPRPEIALASSGDDRVRVVSSCGGTPSAALALLPDVVLPAGEELGDGGTFFADVDGDDRLDLVVQSDAAIRVAYGVGDGTFHGATPVPASGGDRRFATAPLATDEIGRLLAVSDLDGDGAPELVGSLQLVACGGACMRPWEQEVAAAIVVDLDDDGVDDVVTAQGDGLGVRLGYVEGEELHTTPPHELGLLGSAHALVAGDFDHDTVDDVALIERGAEQQRIVVLFGGSIDDWRVATFGPFVEAQALAVDGGDTLVVRTRDGAGRAAGAFIRPGEIASDFGLAIHEPVVVRRGDDRLAAALASDDGTRLLHLGFVAGTLSPHDVIGGGTLDGLDDGTSAIAIAIDLDGASPTTDEVVVLGTTAEGGTVWVARLAGTEWSVVDRFAGVGPGFARTSLAEGGAGSAIAIGDVDGDGDDDVLATTDEAVSRVVVLRNEQGSLSASPPVHLFDRTHLAFFEIAALVRWHAGADGLPRWLVGGDDGVGLASLDLAAGEIRIEERSSAHARALATGDVDRDGLDDLVLATDTEIRIHPALEHIGRD